MLASIVTLFGLMACLQGAAVPKSWKICKTSDADFKGCMKPAIIGAIKELMPGNSALGVESIDPLAIKRLQISKGSGPVSIKLDFEDLVLKNLKHIEFSSLENDWKTLTAKIILPKGIHALSKYTVDGKVLLLPIKGAGNADLQLDHVTIECKAIIGEKMIDGKAHYHMDHLDIIFETKQLHIKLDGLFGGDKALGDSMNKFLNDNWKALLAELKKPITDALSKEILVIINEVFDQFTKDQISPA